VRRHVLAGLNQVSKAAYACAVSFLQSRRHLMPASFAESDDCLGHEILRVADGIAEK
jgi:hypothetical protein